MNALFIVRSKFISFSRNNPKYQNVWGPPEHSSIGNVHSDILPFDIITFKKCCSKQLQVGLSVLSDVCFTF